MRLTAKIAVIVSAVCSVLLAYSPSALAVAGSATAGTACSDGHVVLTVTATLPTSTAYVTYRASNVGTFDLGPSISAGVWSVWVTRRSGRTAESWNLTAKYPATECAL